MKNKTNLVPGEAVYSKINTLTDSDLLGCAGLGIPGFEQYSQQKKTANSWGEVGIEYHGSKKARHGNVVVVCVSEFLRRQKLPSDAEKIVNEAISMGYDNPRKSKEGEDLKEHLKGYVNSALKRGLLVYQSIPFNSIEQEEEIIEILENKLVESIKGRVDIGPTVREQLIKSRRGQGIFKENVCLNESGCRITGITDLIHLRASHIKPWKDCTNEERLNGCNGLLLSPHFDHLFDRGFISFSDDGNLLISSLLNRQILSSWGVISLINVGPFNKEQIKFLSFHRENVFKK